MGYSENLQLTNSFSFSVLSFSQTLTHGDYTATVELELQKYLIKRVCLMNVCLFDVGVRP